MVDTLTFLKGHKTVTGQSVEKFLSNKYIDGEWIRRGNELIYNIVISGMNVQYKWKIANGYVEAVSGKAVELTPDLHPGSKKIADRKIRLPSRDLKIYEFISTTFGELDDMRDAFSKAQDEFGLDDGEAEKIYLSIDSMIYK